jgi:hypothetical protein
MENREVDASVSEELISKLLKAGKLDCRQPGERQSTWNNRFSRVYSREKAREELISPSLTLGRCIELIVSFSDAYKGLRAEWSNYQNASHETIKQAKALYFYEVREDLKILKLAMIRGAQIVKGEKEIPFDAPRFLRVTGKPSVCHKIPTSLKQTYTDIASKCARPAPIN